MVRESVRVWRPAVPTVHEVLHATFHQHAYPAHTHDDWTVLLVDSGSVAYDLDRTAHRTSPTLLTVLPPQVPHDGRTAVDGTPFRKRVLYLAPDWLPAPLVGGVVRAPEVLDPGAVALVSALHRDLLVQGESLAVESGVLALGDLVRAALGDPVSAVTDAPLARRLRELLDDRLVETFTVQEAGALLHAHPSHLVRAFSRAYGIAPHRYVTGRRVDRARRLLLRGLPPAEVAVAVGFHDQAHLGRHFRKVLGTTPGVFARQD